jgi:hypothetical protein
MLTACKISDTFHCTADEQCRLDSVTGFCESTGFCSFLDTTCASGHRYDETAGQLGRRCVDGARARKKAITIDGTKIAAPLIDFPVWLDIVDADVAMRAQSDGSDLELLASDGTPLAYEIQGWDAGAGHLTAWVKIPQLNPGSDVVIDLRYGVPRNAAPDPKLVFGNGFAAVWHLDDALTTAAVVDATATRSGTAIGGLDATHQIAARLGGGIDFDGIADEIQFTNPLSGATSHTISVWIDARTQTTFGSIVTVGSPTTNGSRWFEVHFVGPGVAAGFYGNDWQDSGVAIQQAGWTLLHWVFDAPTRVSRLYRDGVQVGMFTHAPGIDTAGTGGHIGNAPIEWGAGTTNPVPLTGTLDELRIATVTRTAGWIATEYENQSSPSTFYRVGDEELVP